MALEVEAAAAEEEEEEAAEVVVVVVEEEGETNRSDWCRFSELEVRN